MCPLFIWLLRTEYGVRSVLCKAILGLWNETVFRSERASQLGTYRCRIGSGFPYCTAMEGIRPMGLGTQGKLEGVSVQTLCCRVTMREQGSGSTSGWWTHATGSANMACVCLSRSAEYLLTFPFFVLPFA